MVRPEGSSCGCRASSPGRIHVLESMKVVDPRNTPIAREPGDEEIKVLLIPDNGGQSLVIFPLARDEVHCTVEHLLVALKSRLRDLEVDSVYLVSDPVNNVRYIAMVRTKSGCDTSENSEIPSSTSQCSTSSTSAKSTPTKRARKRRKTAAPYSYEKKSNDIVEIQCADTDQRLTLDLRRNAEVIVTYPQRTFKHGITITIEDFKCLGRDEYLNDIIIDFYLKYLDLELLPKRDQERTYVFSSFFYTRLTNPRLSLADAATSRAMLQHAEVKKWTKGVNIFEKDFLIIPINQNDHWFLCVVCYPALIRTKRNKSNKINSLEEQQYPCIVIFDSLPSIGISKPQVVRNLKSYLECEHIEKYGKSDLYLDNIEIIYADVPHQLNSSDCGLYLLQFAEQFFKDFLIADSLRLLKKPMNNWFKANVIKQKREEIKKLIIRFAIDSKNQNK